jgi:hypothetical protein
LHGQALHAALAADVQPQRAAGGAVFQLQLSDVLSQDQLYNHHHHQQQQQQQQQQLHNPFNLSAFDLPPVTYDHLSQTANSIFGHPVDRSVADVDAGLSFLS